MGGLENSLFKKNDPLDLSKNVKNLLKKGVSPHLREFEESGPKSFTRPKIVYEAHY